ncbi:MAG: hypothetical protein ACR2JM_16245 [Mycobacterium sp.]
MIRSSAAGLLVLAFLAAPAASADPQDLEPNCSSGQEPATGACTQQPGGVYTNDAPGADPLVPMGVSPDSVPAV